MTSALLLARDCIIYSVNLLVPVELVRRESKLRREARGRWARSRT